MQFRASTGILMGIVLTLSLSACKNAVPIVSSDADHLVKPTPPPTMTSTLTSFAAASGSTNDGTHVIKFTIGYNVMGAVSNDGIHHIKPTTVGVAK